MDNKDEDINISKEELDIIDFLNERQIFYESEIQPKILQEVKEKYGELGEKVANQLNNDLTHDVEDCKDCGKVSEEWIKESQEKLQHVETFLNTDLDDIAFDITEQLSGDMMHDSDIKRFIVAHGFFELNKIPDEFLQSVKKKVLFMGIVNGWLLDDHYVKD